ncbi:MAG: hypothetical protein KDI36_17670, partial [Pseudomonadales bacterium]|nr:hypothetical protein [Pseudomonadales bacterium]
MTNSGTVLGKLGMLFILCLLSVVCQAQPVILSTHNTGVIDLALHLEKFPDPSRELTIDDIRELPDASWQQNELPFISGPVTHDAIWFRFTVQTRKPGEHRWVLQSRDSLKQQFDLWILRDGKVAEHLQARPAEGFSQRVIQHRDFVFPVELSDFSESVFYIRVTTNQRLVFPLELMPERLFHERDQFHLLLMAMNAGIMLVMLVYNLFIYFSTRDISYLYYGGIVITAGLFFGAMDGLAFQYIWPDLPQVQIASSMVFGILTPAFAALFTMHFLNIRERLPLMRKLLLGYVVCSVLITLFPIFGD